MSKAVLEFKLPEEKAEYDAARVGSAMISAFHEFDNFLRAEIKYNDDLSEEVREAYVEIREKFREICHENAPDCSNI